MFWNSPCPLNLHAWLLHPNWLYSVARLFFRIFRVTIGALFVSHLLDQISPSSAILTFFFFIIWFCWNLPIFYCLVFYGACIWVSAELQSQEHLRADCVVDISVVDISISNLRRVSKLHEQSWHMISITAVDGVARTSYNTHGKDLLSLNLLSLGDLVSISLSVDLSTCMDGGGGLHQINKIPDLSASLSYCYLCHLSGL